MAAHAKLMRSNPRNRLKLERWHGREYGQVLEHLLNNCGALKSSRKEGRGT
jgi:hypothetical protein